MHAAKRLYLISQHESALIEERNVGYNEAMHEFASKALKLKDNIYKDGYDLGLRNVLSDHELFSRTILCPLELFPAEVSFDSEKEDDEAGLSSPPPKA